MRCLPLVLALAAPALAAGPEGEAKLQQLIAGRTAGPARSCVPLQPSARWHTIERVGVVYELGGTRYVSRFEQGCPELTAFTIAVTRTPGTQLCAGDIADILPQTPPRVPVGACIYGRWTPYPRPR